VIFRRSRFRVLAAGVALALSSVARAASTSPTLALSAAIGSGAGLAHGATVEGSFDFPNAVQPGYPLQLVVYQGTQFARFQVGGPVVTGASALLADGSLDQTELVAFLGQGAPAPAGVRIVTVTSSLIRVTLPSTFAPGSATAVLFTVLADGSVVSNALPFVLP
jgi:hypothetical protein